MSQPNRPSQPSQPSRRGVLALLTAAAAGLAAALSLATATSAAELASTPPAWWGAHHLASAVTALTSGLGALGAAWHAVSAALALVALPHTPAGLPAGPPGPARRSASRALERWGAPLVRRLAAGALAVSISAAPAYATEAGPGGDDLGWWPTSSAQQEGPNEPGSPGPGATGPQTAPPAQDEAPSPDDIPDGAPESVPDAAPGSGPDGVPGGTVHTVVPGESLWSITAARLPAGSGPETVAAAWPVLYEANRATVGPDPTTVRPGTVLVVPQDLTP